MTKLSLMVGIPASGKTSVGANFNGGVYISRDEIHQMLKLGYSKAELRAGKEAFMFLIETALKAGRSVVADATHLNIGSRKPLVDLAKICGVQLEAVVIKTDLETCIVRNARRTQDVRVPFDTLMAMYKSYVEPTEAEGFDKIIFINGGK